MKFERVGRGVGCGWWWLVDESRFWIFLGCQGLFGVFCGGGFGG